MTLTPLRPSQQGKKAQNYVAVIVAAGFCFVVSLLCLVILKLFCAHTQKMRHLKKKTERDVKLE